MIFYLFVHAQVLTQFRDVDIHRARIEIVVVDPDLFQSKIALEDLVHVSAEQAEEFALLGGQLLLRFAVVHFCIELFFDALCIGFVRARVAEDLLLRVESIVLTDVVEGAFAVLLALNATKDRLDAEGEFFHRERLREVVVGAI